MRLPEFHIFPAEEMPHIIFDHQLPTHCAAALMEDFEERLRITVFPYDESLSTGIQTPGYKGAIPPSMEGTKAYWKTVCYNGRSLEEQYQEFGLEFVNGDDIFWFGKQHCDILLASIENMSWATIMANVSQMHKFNAVLRKLAPWQQTRCKWHDFAQIIGATKCYLFRHSPNEEVRIAITRGANIDELLKDNFCELIPLLYHQIDNWQINAADYYKYVVIDNFSDLVS